MTQTRFLNKLRLASFSIALAALGSATFAGELSLWPRGSSAYLVAGQPMPIWPALPDDFNETEADILLSITLPSGFEITAVGESRAFGLHPKPLAIPSKVEKVSSGKNEVYQLSLPKAQFSSREALRLSLMIDPGATNKPGDYSCTIEASTVGGGKRCEPLTAKLQVLEPLQGKRPRRLTLGIYNYHGYANPKFSEAIEKAVLNSGINTICDMRPIENGKPDFISLTPSLSKEGLGTELYWFWNSFAGRIRNQFPEAVMFDKDGRPDPSKHAAAATWIIANKEKVMPLLIEDLRSQLGSTNYRAVVNDNEVRGMDREGKIAYGDIHNPGAMEAFAQWAKINEPVPANPAHIAEHYREQWISYRCWQSAQMSALLAEAIATIDPTLGYGLYSGYEYDGKFDNFTRQLYSVDWGQMVQEGKIQFGCAGYYGGRRDLAATARALGEVPYIAAEMFIEHFLEHKRRMPGPDEFKLRLLSALLDSGGKGGLTLWYLPVFEGAAFSATAQVSQIMSEIEDFLLDGERVSNDSLSLSRNIDPASTFAYTLGERRLVIIINRGKTRLPARVAWKNAVPKPDTVEIVSGKRLGHTALIETTIAPMSYVAFLTASEGN